jgi:uncharacterized membrane protein
MRNFALFLHVAAAILWMGGMAFMVLALRPVLHAQLPPPQRLPLLKDVLTRFFAVVGASIAVLLATGGYLLLGSGAGAAPGWKAMSALGLLMTGVFAFLYNQHYLPLRSAVQAQDWPRGGHHAGRIALLVKINLGLGWLAIAAVLLWR